LRCTVSDDTQNCQKFGATSLDLWLQFHREWHASVPVPYVGDSCIHHAISQVSLLWGPASVQAMGYPIRENALRRSLICYILHPSTST